MNQLRDVLVRHGILGSEKLARQPLALQLFFRNLLHLGDRNAVFEANAADIRLDLYRQALDRVKATHIQDWLAECERLGLVRLFTKSGKAYGQIVGYGQRDGQRRALHPKPNEAEPELPLTADPPRSEVKRSEREEERARAGAPEWSALTGWVQISAEDRAGWQAAYPACDIERQLAQMNQWLRANPAKAVKSNWLRFITNWLKREQDRGGDMRGGTFYAKRGTSTTGRHFANSAAESRDAF